MSQSGTSAAGDRGRQAAAPAHIPMRGWRDVLVRVWREMDEDNLSIVAAGVAFYALFAIFPAISALVTLYGLITDPHEVERQLTPLQSMVPADAYNILHDQTLAVVKESNTALSFGLAFGLALAIWSATKGTKALLNALNIAYEQPEQRGFLRLNLTAIGFTLAGVLFTIIALVMIAAVPAAVAILGEGGVWETVLLVARWVVMAALLIGALAFLYRFGPSRAPAKLVWISPGAVAATVMWLAGSALFSLYVTNFADYHETFGSLGAVAVLLMWFYISAYVVCIGAELNAELEHQTERDSTTGAERPLGQRGAYVADHVAAPPQ
jgi:membrane protein